MNDVRDLAHLAPTATHWTVDAVDALLALPFMDLLFRAQQVHRAHHAANTIQQSTLVSIKTGGCSEDCGYCSQSARHGQLEREALLSAEAVIEAARAAQAQGATRFCMGAAWRGPKERELDRVVEMVEAVKALGLETCVTLGMLKPGQAQRLAEAGLDYYNHNLDTAPDFYANVVTSHTQQDRLDTLAQIRAAGIKVCCGGIVGMGESHRNRAALIAELANLDPVPESVPINNLVPIPGSPLQDAPPIDPFDFVRTIAAARIAMPASQIRLSAGREAMSDELQALCFLAGANSIFHGDKLLTTGNSAVERDAALFQRLGLTAC